MTETPWMGVVGAVLFEAYLLAHPALDAASVRNSPYAVIHMIGAAAMALIVVGMLGIAQSIWPRVGRYGKIAYRMAFVGSVLWVGLMFFDAFVNPVLAAYAPELVHSGIEREIALYGSALAGATDCGTAGAGRSAIRCRAAGARGRPAFGRTDRWFVVRHRFRPLDAWPA